MIKRLRPNNWDPSQEVEWTEDKKELARERKKLVLDIPEFRQWRRPFELDLLEEQRISEEARRQSLAARQEAAAAAVEAPR